MALSSSGGGPPLSARGDLVHGIPLSARGPEMSHGVPLSARSEKPHVVPHAVPLSARSTRHSDELRYLRQSQELGGPPHHIHPHSPQFMGVPPPVNRMAASMGGSQHFGDPAIYHPKLHVNSKR